MIAKENPSFCSTLTAIAPVLGEDFNINFVIQNKAQEKEFEEKKTDLINYLREKLDNYQLMITIKVEAIVQEAKLYSSKDKYNKLAEKNPTLNEWRSALGLEIEW